MLSSRLPTDGLLSYVPWLWLLLFIACQNTPVSKIPVQIIANVMSTYKLRVLL